MVGALCNKLVSLTTPIRFTAMRTFARTLGWLGALLALFQLWAWIPFAVFLAGMGLSRMVSLGSILAGISVAVISFCVPALRPYWPFGLLAALLVVYTHRANIARILSGSENRIGRPRG